jgi:hypothetical protein
MRKFLLLMIVLCGALIARESVARAAPPAQSADRQPAITSFTTPVTAVDRTTLANRTARIPVSWVAINRPLIANLVFEQVLPDGSAINVELPRLIPWVASVGDGIAAPILPAGDAREIRLRVRLVHMLTGHVYDMREIILPIGTGGGQSGGTGARPAITSFASCCATSVSLQEMNSRTARVPVSWNVVNRPVTANLVFEQVLPDGGTVNVELPRENPWVASAGDGVMAPVVPGNDATQVVLRVRLFDFVNGRIYDQREFALPVSGQPAPPPVIRFFTAGVGSVNASDLAARTARIPVSWLVENRPPGTNLVFEQALPDGRVLNVELPRPIVWVASSGNGVVAPVLPSGAPSIRLQMRLVLLDNPNNTLLSAEITLPISGGGTPDPGGAVQIRAFAASPDPVERGGVITLSWDVVGAKSISITRLAERSGVYLESIATSLPTTGSVTYAIPNTYTNSISFVLLTENSQINQYVTLAIRCPHPNMLGADCPITQVFTQAAYQSFEGGHMIWRADTREIYVLFMDGSYKTFVDTWAEGETLPVETPPAGRVQPVRGFGKIWSTQSDVRSRLGWAMQPESAHSVQIETYKYWRGHYELTGIRLQLGGGLGAMLEDRWQQMTS